MELTIIEEKENPFFKRKDLKIRIKQVGPTPSKAEIVKELAAKYSVDESQVQIDYIFSKRGLKESFVNCKILHEKPKIEQPKPAEGQKPATEGAEKSEA